MKETAGKRPHELTLNADEVYTVAFCSLRYALGRQTYVVRDVCQLLRRVEPLLGRGQLNVLIRDIDDHGRDVARLTGRPQSESYGMPCDYRDWMDLRRDLVAARETRGHETDD